MDDDLIILVDYDNICRLCLLSTGSMSDIFAKYKSMQQKILCITGLAIEKNDGLPSKICHRCRHIVEQACELRDVVDRSFKILARIALETTEKQSDVHENENESNINDYENGDVHTVTIEYFKNGDLNGTIVEEFDLCTESNETELEIIENNQDSHSEKRVLTEIPVSEFTNKSHGKKPPQELVCQLCLSSFATKEEVRTHVEQHYTGSDLQIYLDITTRPFTCTACDEVQLNKPQLVKHHRRHLQVNPYKCKHPGCTYVGKDRDGIRHHRVVHEAPNRVCDECGAAFRRRSDLVSHMVRNHPRADQALLSTLVCASCGFRSRNEPALRRHMKAHHFAPRFPCPYGSCERAYRSARALADHERAHRGQRRYRCPLCNLADYTSTSSLKRHMKMHSRSCKSKCDKCPATFEEYGAFYRHRIAHHGPWQPHRCRACNQGYQSETQLNKHEQTCERLKRLLAYEEEQTQNGQTDTKDCMEIEEQAAGLTEDGFDQNNDTVYIEIERADGTDGEES